MPNIIKTTNPAKHNTRKRALIVISVVVLLAIGVGGYFYWQNYRSNQSSGNGETALKKLDGASLAKEINKLVEEKKYDEASELIKYQDDSSTDPATIVMLARVFSEKGEYPKAIKLLNEAAAKKDKDAHYYTGHEARMLAMSGDKQAAINKYVEAKEIAASLKVDPKDERSELRRLSLMADYQTEIDSLKGQQ